MYEPDIIDLQILLFRISLAHVYSSCLVQSKSHYCSLDWNFYVIILVMKCSNTELNRKDGSLLWEEDIGIPAQNSEENADTDITANPSRDEGKFNGEFPEGRGMLCKNIAHTCFFIRKKFIRL